MATRQLVVHRLAESGPPVGELQLHRREVPTHPDDVRNPVVDPNLVVHVQASRGKQIDDGRAEILFPHGPAHGEGG